MPVDAAVQQLLDAMAAAGGPPLHEQSVADARDALQAIGALGLAPEVARVEERTIPGPAGTLPVRVYRPSEDDGLPVVVWLHGGGWVIGDLETADANCRSLCTGTDAVVVSVDYRLAPEHPYPAALDDCMAAVEWVGAHADEVGADPTRIAVAGDSAGGNLAAVIARKTAVPLRFQLLVYPVTDCRFETMSHVQNGAGYLLTHAAMEWFFAHYAAGGVDRCDPDVSPVFAEDLTGLPPALVITAEFDPLRDEGEAYAKALAGAGVPVTSTRYDGMIHGFFQMSSLLPDASTAMTEATDALREAFR